MKMSHHPVPLHTFGLWWHPDFPENLVPGHLAQEGLGKPTLQLMNAPTYMYGAKQSSEHGWVLDSNDTRVPILHGIVAEGHHVTVIDAHRAAPGSPTSVQCELVVEGERLNDHNVKWCRRIELGMPCLQAILGKSIDVQRLSSDRSDRFNIRADDRAYQWQSEGVEITWDYAWRSETDDKVFFNIEMEPVVTLASARPQSLRYWMHEWVYPMLRLVETATLLPPRLTYIHAWRRKNLRDMDLRRPVVIRDAGVGPHDLQISNSSPLITPEGIDRNPNGFADVLRRVAKLEEEHSIFTGLVAGASRSPDRPKRNRYLDLTGAIEAYHSTRYGIGPLQPEQFEELKSDSLLAIELAEILDGQQLKFIKQELPNRSVFALHRRIGRVAKQVGLRPAEMNPNPDRLAAIRNDIAHGKMTVSAQELDRAHREVERICRLIFLHELGIALPSAEAGL